MQHGQCWQQKQQAASALNQIHGQADSHCLCPTQVGGVTLVSDPPQCCWNCGHGNEHSQTGCQKGWAWGLQAPAQGRVLVLGGRLCLWIHQVHSSPDTKAALCLQTKLSRNHSPRQVPWQQRLLHWVMECDGATGAGQPSAHNSCQSLPEFKCLDNTFRHIAIFHVLLWWDRAWT